MLEYQLNVQKQELADQNIRNLEYPLSCLGSDNKIAWYIDSIKELERDNDTMVTDHFKLDNEDTDEEFQIFLDSPENQQFIETVKDLAFQFQNYGHHLSEEEYFNLLVKKARHILKLEFEASKNKAKSMLVQEHLKNATFQVQNLRDKYFQDFGEDGDGQAQMKEHIENELARLESKRKEFSYQVSECFEKMVLEMEQAGYRMPKEKAEIDLKVNGIWQKSHIFAKKPSSSVYNSASAGNEDSVSLPDRL